VFLAFFLIPIFFGRIGISGSASVVRSFAVFLVCSAAFAEFGSASRFASAASFGTDVNVSERIEKKKIGGEN
jgi:Kef-type K+ transport system membrane component KefB